MSCASHRSRALQDGAIGASAVSAAKEQPLSAGDDIGNRLETFISNDDRPPPRLPGEAEKNTISSPSSPPNETGQAGESSAGINNSRASSTSRPLAGLGSTCQERIETVTSYGIGGTATDKLLSTHPTIMRKDPTRAGLSNTPKRHPLDTLRMKGFGSEYGSRSGGGVAGGMDAADEITKLKASLKRAREETARERERRAVCEEQASLAYASLEAESKR